MIDWKPFLSQWSKQILQSSLAPEIYPPIDSTDWLGFKAATKRSIQNLEKRLGVSLPPSYRAFLQVSNGWRRTTQFVGRIRPVEEVNWFRIENSNCVELFSQDGSDHPDTEYYTYGPDGAGDQRAQHMVSLLQISDVDDGVYLLNPMSVTPDGEWEAWFFADWVPGATRFPSFAHLMLREYQAFAELENIEVDAGQLPRLEIIPPTVSRTSVVPEGDAELRTAHLQEIMEEMSSPDKRVRAKAVRTLIGTLVGRPSAEQQPGLVQPLVQLFRTSDDAEVRSACVQAMTELAEDDQAPPSLLEALSDPDPGVVLSGIFALKYFPNDRALQPLCDFIESRQNVLINETAMGMLGEMRSQDAVPTLAGVLLDTDSEFDQSFSTAAMALAHCGKAGFEVLASAVRHSDPRIRLAAVVGLDVSGNEAATVFLDHALDDVDERVRQRAKVRLGKMW